MQRISMALDRAREEWGMARAGSPSLGLVRSDPAMPMPIRYTRTRAVAVDAAHLAEQRLVARAWDADAQTQDSQSRYADSYRMLRTRILQELRLGGWRSLAITSPGAGEGKTLTTINLALSLAMDLNQTVLLIEADLRAPNLHERFGFAPGKGLSDYLQGEAGVGEILVHPGIDRLVLLPGGSPVAQSAELLASPRMGALSAELKQRYRDRLILVDLPCLLHAADALAFLHLVEAALLVVEECGTRQEDLARAVSLLAGTPLLGAVLNKSRVAPGATGRVPAPRSGGRHV